MSSCFLCLIGFILFFLRTSKVISPIKVSLTPCKDGEEQQVEDEILTLDSEEEEISQEKPPGMWAKEIFMKEQSEEYDSLEDPEYVPPSIIYETDKEYDEVRDDLIISL